MDRRTTLRALATAASAIVAGCTGAADDEDGTGLDRYETVDGGTPTPPPTPTPEPPSIKIGDIDDYETDDGRLGADATAENRGNDRETAVVVAALARDGERTERTERVSLDPDESITVSFAFDVGYEEFKRGSTLSFDVRRPDENPE